MIFAYSVPVSLYSKTVAEVLIPVEDGFAKAMSIPVPVSAAQVMFPFPSKSSIGSVCALPIENVNNKISKVIFFIFVLIYMLVHNIN